MEIDEIITRLKSLSNPKSVEGMARYGINPEKTLGVSIPALRKMAKEIGRSHLDLHTTKRSNGAAGKKNSSKERDLL